MKEKRDSFIQCEKKVFEAYGFLSPVTKEVVPLSPIDKIIYLVMRDRHHFFTVVRGGEYFESQDTTAELCGTFRRKVNETVKVLIKHGVIKARKKRIKKNVSWVYEKILPLDLRKLDNGEFLCDRDYNKTYRQIEAVPIGNVSIEDMGEPDW